MTDAEMDRGIYSPRAALVSARVVRGLAGAVDRAGGSGQRLLIAAGLSPTANGSDDATLTRSELYKVIELAITLSNDSALGLHWCEKLSEAVFDLTSQIVKHSPNLRCGLGALARFHGLLSEPAGYDINERAGRVTVRAVEFSSESPAVSRFIGEGIVCGFVGLLRTFSPGARPDWIGFRHAAPSYSEEYVRVFRQPVQFGAAFTGVTFDAALLELGSPYPDEALYTTLCALAERRISDNQTGLPTSMRVRRYLVERSAHRRITMREVAHALAMSSRALRRQLDKQGTTFRIVANEASSIVAEELLLGENCSLAETAEQMGFAHLTTFHRAFKRWTGVTPRSLRLKTG